MKILLLTILLSGADWAVVESTDSVTVMATEQMPESYMKNIELVYEDVIEYAHNSTSQNYASCKLPMLNIKVVDDITLENLNTDKTPGMILPYTYYNNNTIYINMDLLTTYGNLEHEIMHHFYVNCTKYSLEEQHKVLHGKVFEDRYNYNGVSRKYKIKW